MMAKHPLPIIAPGTVDASLMTPKETAKQATGVIDVFNAALHSGDTTKLQQCFFPEQAYWRDQLALTYHIRTFIDAGVIAESFLDTAKLRGIPEGIKIEADSAKLVSVTPVLQLIECSFTFRTKTPAATCRGRLQLLPIQLNGALSWKVWVLSTWLKDFDNHPENEALLREPSKSIDGLGEVETEVLIIGAGNAGVTLAARLKALGVGSVMVEKNPRPGDNWALRYENLKFHIPTAACELPYLRYPDELQSPRLLKREELAEQVRRYAAAFDLKMIGSAKILSTVYDQGKKRWTVRVTNPAGERSITCSHLVQATGVGSQQPNIPQIDGGDLFKGVKIHSAHFKNARELKDSGVKSAIVIGSANTAFDVLEDCYKAGLKTTVNARSPTYFLPLDYIANEHVYGSYDRQGIEAADNAFMTGPLWVDSNLTRGLFAHMASMEPDRYKALTATGFPVIDSSHPQGNLFQALYERAGGHYIDVGTPQLLIDGKVAVKAGVEPVAYTSNGLKFSDGSTLNADAVVWCTGFKDQNASSFAAEILGHGKDASNMNGKSGNPNLLGPTEVASRLDRTWGVDAEGEVNGMWKRHLHMENYWTAGGHTQFHRWHSRTLALQIKADLMGVLPPAYRNTPGSKL
ncbi:hypothetical protein F5Y15DRAFT_407096 [Xylariaceae sp. FL0016]|nr:hypothetical protein F5Y15DRAFT_407096 [Xylariaceae sp. FL0016]